MTRALTDRERIELWEAGLGRRPWERSILALSVARREPVDALMALPIGRRDAALLDLFEWNFGVVLRGFARCPCCGTALEFDAPTLAACRPSPSVEEAVVHTEGHVLSVRPPDTRDVSVALDSMSAREALLRRCVTRAALGELEVGVDALPPQALDAVEHAVEGMSPQADITFALTCASCGHTWAAPFDVTTFLWSELGAAARRLLDEVHTLARAYGWSEGDVLAMGPRRRAAYLERVS